MSVLSPDAPGVYWASLSLDVLSVVLRKLGTDDQLSVALTCRSWKECFDSSVAVLRPRVLRTDVIARRFPCLLHLHADTCIAPQLAHHACGRMSLADLGHPMSLRSLSVPADVGFAPQPQPFCVQLVADCLQHLTALTALTSLDLSGQSEFEEVLARPRVARSPAWGALLGRLRTLKLRGSATDSGRPLPAAAARALLRCTRLLELDIAHQSASALLALAAAGVFSRLTQLQLLDLSGTRSVRTSVALPPKDAAGDAAAADAPLALPCLLELRMPGVTFASDAPCFAPLSTLTLLDLSRCHFLRGFASFLPDARGLARLRELRLNSARLGVGSLWRLTALTALETLDLSAAQDLRLAPLAEFVLAMPSLESLDLSEAHVEDDEAHDRGGAARLRAPALVGVGVAASEASSSSARARWAAAPEDGGAPAELRLRHLNLARSPTALRLLEQLARHAALRLESLDVSHCIMLSARVLAFIHGCTSLRSLNLARATKSLSPPQDTAVVAALPHLQRLTHLAFEEGHSAAEALAFFLPRLRSLRSLSLRSVLPYPNLSKVLTAALPDFRDLERLDLSHAALSPDCAAHLGRLTRLKTLLVAQSSLSAAGLAELVHLGGLEHLDATKCPLTDDAAASVCALTGLTRLSLSETRITDATLAALPALKRLCHLSIVSHADPRQRSSEQRMRISAAGLNCLAQCPRLKRLSLSRRLAQDYNSLRTLSQKRSWDDWALLPEWVHLEGCRPGIYQ